MVWLVTTLILWFWMSISPSAEVRKEWWSKEAPSVTEAFARYAPRRIGILLVAFDRTPKPGMRYWKDSENRGPRPKRMPDRYELRLYDVLRQALQGQGYEVQCLNTRPWRGLRLREVVAQAQDVDAVYTVHYTVSYTHKVWDRMDYTWWTPFKAMRLKVRCAVFDVSSGDLIYGLEGETLSTEALYAELGDIMAEEPLYPKGYDEHGKYNTYQIAIYQTSVRDPKEGERSIPMIRTGKGALDISLVKNPVDGGQIYDPMTLREVQKDAENRSVLNRLLNHVAYRPQTEEIAYFERLTIGQCGEMLGKQIPKP
ncbi:MAG: hypothetical protein O7G87_16865 [bacterium]|nr:hypothetical protein [bacterium]